MLKKKPYLYEIPILYLILYGVNRAFLPELPAFFGMDPHPFWLGILLFGFRYGLPAGMASGLVSASLYLTLNWFYGERYLFEDLNFYLLPVFFIMGGVMIGLGVERYQKRNREQEKEAVLFKQNEEVLQEELKTVQEINRGLEKRIVTKMATLVTLYEGAKRLETVELGDLYPAILEFIAKTTGAEELSFYLREEGHWEVKARYGWKDDRKYQDKLALNEGIAGLAGASNKIITIRDFIGANLGTKEIPKLLGDCLIAGPLRKGEQGEVIGVVAIHHIPFLSFNSATLNLFSFILEWGSRAVKRASYVTELKAQEILDPEFRIYSRKYFESRLRQEFSRSQTYYLPLEVNLIKIKDLTSLNPTQRTNLLTTVSEVLRNCSRDVDVVARYSEPEIPFALLLITASPKQGEEIRKKIEETLKPFLENTAFHIGKALFSPKVTTTDQFLTMAREDLKK